MPELKLKPGWLKANLERAAKKVAEWEASPIYKAQMERAREREQK